MKYGKTERISGLVILVALAIIVLPWLMSEPAPRPDRQQPSFTIERPIDVPRQDISAPEKPESIQLVDEPLPVSSESQPAPANNSDPEPQRSATPAEPQDTGDTSRDKASEESSRNEQSSRNDAIPAATSDGEWGVQIGSFGNPENVARLTAELEEQGFSVFTRERNEELTAVLVGPFATSAQGESAMALVKERVNYQGLLVRVRD